MRYVLKECSKCDVIILLKSYDEDCHECTEQLDQKSLKKESQLIKDN